ncbi:MAG: hypothetical protein EOM91_22230, partial [Sphingobacteriia bacterium]|nr:hypothetical protein [Sphingobacteriia bacterium]
MIDATTILTINDPDADAGMSVPQGPRKRRGPEARRRALELTQSAGDKGAQHRNVCPGNEYPTTLTRIPLFRPGLKSKRNQKNTGDTNTGNTVWEPLASAWSRGAVIKSGPDLGTYDEDTLIGMIQLREDAFLGPAHAMPLGAPAQYDSPLSREPLPGADERASATQEQPLATTDIAWFVSTFSLDQLETRIRGPRPARGWGGRDLALRVESIHRLSAVLFRFTVTVNESFELGRGPFGLFRMDTVGVGTDVHFYIQWDPLLSKQLECYRSYIDLAVRRGLTPLGKALHRFLTSQVSEGRYAIPFDIMIQAIGAAG